MTGVYRLKGTVKHYDWGGYSFIPALLKMENETSKPFAEYWMGIHPLGVGLIDTGDGNETTLTSVDDKLSYLLKILDVKDMLSIQVHPSREAAVIEFARENAEGIPLDSPIRSYKDDNHKPELMAALGDFWLLHGFKPPEELIYTLLNVVELRELLPIYNATGYAGLYRHVMEMPQEEVNRILKPLVDNIVPLYKEGSLDKNDEDFWAARAAISFSNGENIDRGIFSVYLFNIVHLKKGEAVYQAAGLPHAYLEGQNVEIMANSDNVLRGGLTTKHIDVKELLKHVKCEATYPQILSGEKKEGAEGIYTTPAPDFQLSYFQLAKGEKVSFNTAGTEILLLTDGVATLRGSNQSVLIETGRPAAIVVGGERVDLITEEGATVFRAIKP